VTRFCKQSHSEWFNGTGELGLPLSQSAPTARGILGPAQGPRGLTDAHRGPRIFVGKLNKSTSGQDVKVRIRMFLVTLSVARLGGACHGGLFIVMEQ
jgi:hypothetical protein